LDGHRWSCHIECIQRLARIVMMDNIWTTIVVFFIQMLVASKIVYSYYFLITY
jgi:hypothetical protein